MKKIEIRKGQYRVEFACDNCGTVSTEKESHYQRKARHFCSRRCYSAFRATKLPRNEQNSYGTGHSPEERERRRKCRTTTNHAIRSGILKRKPCEVCGDERSEAHHDDYDKPMEVRWLCFKHHRQHHYESPELIDAPSQTNPR